MLLIGGVRDGQTAKIRYAFSFDKLPVFMQVPVHDIATELIGDALSALREVLEVGGRAPVAQVSLRIEFRALIVEPVRDFVSDNRTGRAVVVRVIAVRIEEGRLKDPPNGNSASGGAEFPLLL